MTGQWHIVPFSDEQEIGIVHKSWLWQNDTQCFWPPYKSESKLRKACKNGELPAANWDTYTLSRTFAVAETYDDAVEKCKIAESSSEIEEKLEDLNNPKMRKLRHQRRLSSGDEDNLKNSKLPYISHFVDSPASLTGSNENQSNETTVKTTTGEKWELTIVQFSDTLKTCAIPSFWIQLDNKICSWPPYKSETIQQCIEEMDEPDDEWEKRNISEVFGSTANYAKAIDLSRKLEAKKNSLAIIPESQPKDSYEE